MSIDNERALAFHEAGHCWGFWYTGRRFRYSTLRPRIPGYDAVTVAQREWWFDELHPAAIVAVCGPLVEILHRGMAQGGSTPRQRREVVEAGAQHDIAKIKNILDEEGQLQLLFRQVHAHWAGITQVADELLELKTVKSPRVFEILDDSDPGVRDYSNMLRIPSTMF